MQDLDKSVREELQHLVAFFGEKEERQKDLCDTVRTLEEVVSTVTKAAQDIKVKPIIPSHCQDSLQKPCLSCCPCIPTFSMQAISTPLDVTPSTIV